MEVCASDPDSADGGGACAHEICATGDEDSTTIQLHVGYRTGIEVAVLEYVSVSGIDSGSSEPIGR